MDYPEIEQLVDLVVRYGGDYEEQLLKVFSPLIQSTARDYYQKFGQGLVELDDCEVYASLAFIWLVRRFDRSRCRHFVPYIKRFITQQMQKLFERELHIPRRAYHRARSGKVSDPAVWGILLPESLSVTREERR